MASPWKDVASLSELSDAVGLPTEKLNLGCVSSYFAGNIKDNLFVYFNQDRKSVQLSGEFSVEDLKLLTETIERFYERSESE